MCNSSTLSKNARAVFPHVVKENSKMGEFLCKKCFDTIQNYGTNYRYISGYIKPGVGEVSGGLVTVDEYDFFIRVRESQYRERKSTGRKYKDYIAMSFSEWGKTLEFFGQKCAYCLGKFEVMDHFIPVTSGGRFVIGNILPACKSCNSSKLNRNSYKWMSEHVLPSLIGEIIFWVDSLLGGHLNGDPQDKKIENLRWGTQKGNGQNRIRNPKPRNPQRTDKLQKDLLREAIKERSIAVIAHREKTISEVAKICHLSISAISRRMTRGGYRAHTFSTNGPLRYRQVSDEA